MLEQAAGACCIQLHDTHIVHSIHNIELKQEPAFVVQASEGWPRWHKRRRSLLKAIPAMSLPQRHAAVSATNGVCTCVSAERHNLPADRASLGAVVGVFQ